MNREQELVRDGWTKCATYDEPRLSEMVALYEEIGFEVHLEPLDPNALPPCAECIREAPHLFRTIYTRKR
ncbi:MAG: hypothetical protein JSV80_07630 [Acidobacteriota bacterium]|nr:MAG: hypothetical protein JSV80_07630 [Acidobacteriota bacterium]